MINPGHAIESSWFIMREAEQRQDKVLLKAALEILDANLERGWDPQYGGILYFLDVAGKPPEQLEWDQKLWWPHAEALYATLYAHYLTGEARYLEWFEKIMPGPSATFRTRNTASGSATCIGTARCCCRLKGNNWKGFFHVPRALMLALELLEKMPAED